MKLAFCLFKYFPYGGLQRDFLRIANACLNRGHEVHVYTMKWDGPCPFGIKRHIVAVSPWQNHTRCRAFAEKARAQWQKESYDLVVGFNKMPGLDVYYAADVCYQARVASRHFIYRLTPRYRQWIALEKAVFQRGAKTEIMLISPLQQEAFVQCYQTEVQRLALLPPGIIKDRIATKDAGDIRSAVRKWHQLSPEDTLLLMVGSGFKTKGLDRAIISLAALPDDKKKRCQLWVIGQDKATAFRRLAKRLGVFNRVKFFGGRDDVPSFLLAADLLLHPARHENTGTVLLEAMVSGLPVLTTDVCGYAHYVEKANAGLVLPSPFKQSEWNRRVAEMLSCSKKSLWQQNGRAFATKADIYSLPEKATDFIEAACQRKQHLSHHVTHQQGPDFYLNPDLVNYFSPTQPLFDQLMALRGESFRHLEGRQTQRIQLGDRYYFIKQHSGVGLKELIKNLLQLRFPIVSAKTEWLAIEKLQSLNVTVPLVVGYGERGRLPHQLQSFILMEELPETKSLEELGKIWREHPPSFSLKATLIAEVARIAKVLHENGINHRDFYLCHFLLNTHGPHLVLTLIDLHRAQIRGLTPPRWIIKDLSGLFFSSKDIGLTERDKYRFIKAYRNKPLREVLRAEKNFWQKIKIRGEKLYREHS